MKNNSETLNTEDEITISVKFPMNLADVLEQFQTTILSKAMEKCRATELTPQTRWD